MTESDGIDEAVTAELSRALPRAEMVGRGISRALVRVAELWERRIDAAWRREARDRYRQAWEQAQERLAVVSDPDWWREASPARIADAYETAVSWRHSEPEAARAVRDIREEVLRRYGLDLDTAAPGDAAGTLTGPEGRPDARREADVAEAGKEADADGERDGDAGPEEPPEVSEGPEPSETPQPSQASERPEPADHDSPEHRDRRAAAMEEAGIEPDLVDAHNRVDRMNAHPPTAAVRPGNGTTPPRGHGHQAQPAMER
ncbi:hypothetical protein ACFPZ0_04140 [Streptomonospora nanhaiensis]|uniref:Uncharacterized protein n=1 Tax=Streptomonospora nanhaiensis TaxID=1323731 RepID=A0A853BS65_9ACTN|nr:hypothetical protein [Streptomonospora nanhaiensis]MBV2362205.1 hypothetical protein [Streptomonospora nanhaiensis]MBX9388147.1 hypothetical protein [Streptomonospora nanhaiensis]NYI97341.1 hypothetical protein [Streptomonospora nanhaiensis]